VESLVLSSIGLALGLWIAAMANRYLRLLLDITDQSAATFDYAVFGFGAVIAAIAALLLSVAPAAHVFKADVIHGLKEAARAGGPRFSKS
jgi:hypothetical protein